MEEPSSCTVLDTRSTSFFVVDEREPNETFAGAFSVSDDEVGGIFSVFVKSLRKTSRLILDFVPNFRSNCFWQIVAKRESPLKKLNDFLLRFVVVC